MAAKRRRVARGRDAERDLIFMCDCDNCGIYPTTEDIARVFLTDLLRSRLDDAITDGAAGAHLVWKGGRCPRCRPDAIYLVEVAALWRRTVH